MLEAIIGDIVGSIYEFDHYRAKDSEFFGRRADSTDDTVCTIAVADALLHGKLPAEALFTIRWTVVRHVARIRLLRHVFLTCRSGRPKLVTCRKRAIL